MTILLYKLNASPPARTVMVTAEYLGLDIQYKDVNVLAKENWTPEYLAMNPLHTIPVLQDGDFVLVDSHAIIAYLVSKYGADKRAQLYPSDLRERAIIDQRMYLDASIVFPRLLTMLKDILFGTATVLDEKKVADAIEAYGFLEKYLEKTPFLAGEHITLADLSCVTTVSSMNLVVPIDAKYPKLLAWLDVLSQEDWYQKKNKPGLDELSTVYKAKLKKNAE